ncbi:MAG TPA: M14 family zinc carboxypeptidase [Nocardioides sp.]|nr:M14 family zinc carboxypeptidase [Nocardioides sp.]
MRLGILTATTLAAGLLTSGLVATPTASYAVRAPDDRPAVVETRVIGHSVKGRPIKAFRLGERGEPKVLLISTMHGDEPHTRQILASLRDGRPIRGLNLWVLPVYNPDGLARHTRKNAHGVDHNRNFPYRWADLDGSYESGPRPGSEPETRAAMRFLKQVRPQWIISFHQPLHGVDTDTKDQRFSRRVADKLNLPRKAFTCGGVCHGTMTGWFNHRFRGTALTAEYGAHPPKRLMRKIAPGQVLSIWGAKRR